VEVGQLSKSFDEGKWDGGGEVVGHGDKLLHALLGREN